jgi:single-stranded-DNA-specific exonuclease
MPKKWLLYPKISKEFCNQFPEYDPLISQLLSNRGIKTQEQIDEFFNPDYSQDLFDPYLFRDMKKAIERIEQAVAKKERVAVYGDYDADGVTSTVILTSLFQKVLGLSGQVYIPDRKTEGYGLNKKAVGWLEKKNIQLIVTCDCGVSNKEEIDYAKSKGIDTIVLDHHHLPYNFSDDYIIINAKRKDDSYPFKELAACGVAFKFAQAVFRSNLLSKVKTIFHDNNSLALSFEKQLLDLVTLGTIADCVPLISENRTLMKYGFAILPKTERPGIKSLALSAGVDLKEADAYSVGFYLAPRINAAGRLDHANTAYKLLATESKDLAGSLSIQLESTNRQRQKLTDEIVNQAKAQIGDVSLKKVLFAEDKAWPLGVVGIVAGKICEEYFRPTLILSKGEKESSGSARSIPAFNIIEAISSCKNILLEYGGHCSAAGFSLENKCIGDFVKRLNKISEKDLSREDLIPQIKIDAELDLSKIDWKLNQMLQNFEPYGAENQKPVFCAKDVKINNVFSVGREGKHLKLKVSDSKTISSLKSKIFEVIGFNFGNKISKIKIGDKIDIAFEVDVNEWNGNKELQLKLVDVNI